MLLNGELLLAESLSPYRLTLCPVLRPLSALSRRTNKCDKVRHLEAHFALSDFKQGDVRGAEITNLGHKRAVPASSARIQLPDALGNQVDQHVGVDDLLKGSFYKFSVHNCSIKSV